ncbi:major facilitator superfamily domain-containing protein, partial [Coniella lustricola]
MASLAPHDRRSGDDVLESTGSPNTSDIEKTASNEKPTLEKVENIASVTSQDEHAPEAQLSAKAKLAFVALAFLWTGSQIPIYLFGAIPPYIYADIGGSDRWTWITLANILALAAVCPFVGSLSDLFGRRYIALCGTSFVILGMIIASTAQTMNIVIGGQVFAGIGAGINELTALAAASEMAPVSKRGKYVGVLVFTITPFCLSALYAQLIAAYASWRYVGLLCALWNLVGLVMTAIFYFPPPRTNPSGLSRRAILQQIDFVGGFLSTSGLILF